MNSKIVLILAIVISCLPVSLSIAATGDILFSSCVGAGNCKTDQNWTGSHISVISNSECHTDDCYQSVFTFSEGGFSPQSVVTGIAGHDEITITYWLKFDHYPIDTPNIKSFRPFFGDGGDGGALIYGAAVMQPHFSLGDFYITCSYDYNGGSVIHGDGYTITPTAAVDSVRVGSYPNYCQSNGDGTYTCPIQGEWTYTTPPSSDTWSHTRMWIKIPTTTSSADGEMAVWIDDVLMVTITDWDIGSTSSTTFSGMSFFPSEDAAEDYIKYVDDVIIYEGYVPPSGEPTPTPTPTPTPDVTCYLDADGDGYSDGTSESVETCSTDYYESSELTAISGDCNDSNAAINPGATDDTCDGIDQDCDGTDDSCVAGNGAAYNASGTQCNYSASGIAVGVMP